MTEPGTHEVVSGRYWNSNYFASAIVATITHEVDWAAYSGGAPVDISREQAEEWVSKFGAKLSEKDARHFFPQLEKLQYRY